MRNRVSMKHVQHCILRDPACIVELFRGLMGPERKTKIHNDSIEFFLLLLLTSGFGSHNNEQIDRRTFDIVKAGDQLLRRISKQMAPLEFIFG